MGNTPRIEQGTNIVVPMEVAQMGMEPLSICAGLVALRFMSYEVWNSKASKHSGYRVKLEDGCSMFVTHPHILLMIRDQLEVRYKVLLWSTGYCLEHPEEVLKFTVDSQTPVIVKREIKVHCCKKYWHHLPAKS